MPIAPPAVVVVYDCMIFVQAVASDRGPAFRCFELAEEHAVSLLVTAKILAEVRDVLGRTELRRRFRHLTDERVEEFLDAVLGFASMSAAPPAVFSLPRDPSQFLRSAQSLCDRCQKPGNLSNRLACLDSFGGA